MDFSKWPEVFLWFTVYSFIGWGCETIYCSIIQRKLVNRGFLSGPVCPIYGFGALFVIWFLSPVKENLWLVFLLGLFITSLLEYVTSFLLEKAFHTSWWDYSHLPLNINGRVCLLNSVEFGLLSVVLMKYIHPFISAVVAKIPYWAQLVATAVIGMYFIWDCTVTIRSILQLDEKLCQMQEILRELKEKSQLEALQIKERWEEKLEETRQSAETSRLHLELTALQEKLAALKQNRKFSHKRLLHAFPHMKSNRYDNALNELKEFLNQKRSRKGN